MADPRDPLTDRRSLSLAAVVGIITLAINLCALVWGAARISGAVDELSRSTDRLNVVVGSLQSGQAAQEARLQVLEDREIRPRGR